MSAHKNIDRICAVVTVIALVLAGVFCFGGEDLGIEASAGNIGYENRIFDNSKVHTIDIVMDDWDSFIETCEDEEYAACSLVIDGESVKNVGLRAKGNTSLSSVKNSGSSRYSFKIEFDQYENGKTYHGLDKLCLNNIIQDNTYMKDYLAYKLMNEFGVDAPLCSYAYITVNGEDWGLYLAVEAIEDSFLERNYGTNHGELYKPDSMSFGGGRGNGRDFSMSDFMSENSDDDDESSGSESSSNGAFQMPGGGDMPTNFPDMGEMPEDFDPSQMSNGEMPEGFDPSSMFGGGDEKAGGGFGGFGGGMGSSDVKLQYSDDEFDSYSNIFNNAKTDVSDSDKKRLISSLKSLTEQKDIEKTVDVDEVLRYFVVHNFLCNGDSYTGMMIHNYYLYEEDGQLSMIPWDYNLAYGSFQGSDSTVTVNTPIDTPVSGGMSDRPMLSWIFSSDEYTERYHELFSEFLESADSEKLVSDTKEMIAEYVEKDATKFCTYEDFEIGTEAISLFCTLREESAQKQLNGTIPSTSEGQSLNSDMLVDASALNISDMGSMGGAGGGFGGGNFGGGNFGGSGKSTGSAENSKAESNDSEVLTNTSSKGGMQPPGNMPEDFDPSQMGNGEMPEGFDPSQMGNGEMPEGFDPSQMGNGEMPEGFDPPNGKTDSSESSTDSKQDKSKTDDSSSDSKESADDSKRSGFGMGDISKMPGMGSDDGSRPSMGDMPSMSSSTEETSKTPYILLGASALVLAAGLVFAIKFRR